MPGPASVEEMGAKVDYQVAAPAKTGTPNLHRAKIAKQQSADGRMATDAARRELKGLTGRRKKKNRLDSHRPSHGRTWLIGVPQISHSAAFSARPTINSK